MCGLDGCMLCLGLEERCERDVLWLGSVLCELEMCKGGLRLEKDVFLVVLSGFW